MSYGPGGYGKGGYYDGGGGGGYQDGGGGGKGYGGGGGKGYGGGGGGKGKGGGKGGKGKGGGGAGPPMEMDFGPPPQLPPFRRGTRPGAGLGRGSRRWPGRRWGGGHPRETCVGAPSTLSAGQCLFVSGGFFL